MCWVWVCALKWDFDFGADLLLLVDLGFLGALIVCLGGLRGLWVLRGGFEVGFLDLFRPIVR